MSSVKYATEENIQSLIFLIKDELEKYATKEDLYAAIRDLPSGGGSGISFRKIDYLPEYGVPGIIYLLRNGEYGDNVYDEYFWDEEEYRFEKLGTVNTSFDGGGEGGSSIRFEVIYALPDTGEPNVIYLLEAGGSGSNRYDEYIWLVEEERFELLGKIDTTDGEEDFPPEPGLGEDEGDGERGEEGDI